MMTRLEITMWGYSKNNLNAIQNFQLPFCMHFYQMVSGKKLLKPGKAGMSYARPDTSRRFSQFRSLHDALIRDGVSTAPTSPRQPLG
ncbi:hypothetical protein B5M09_013454 [Aphanomyces astaci]|uniref:Uncharacterized protein n=1 Tax=Aphanomyces astaci TaxID=112090 RepID=A0A3R7ZMU1_APHAT|nr:hypothetical protein B5M09_013454 [Aphanomyces astaci]